MERIGFHVRAAALLIDLAVFALAAHAACALDVLVNEGAASNFGMITAGGAWVALAILGLMEALHGLMEALHGVTAGKRLMRLVIAREDGRPAYLRALLLRAAIKYAPLMFALFPIVMFPVASSNGPWSFPGYVRDGLMAVYIVDVVLASSVLLYVIVGCFRALRPDRQAFHDLLAHTAVFRRKEMTGRGFVPVLPAGWTHGPAPLPVIERMEGERPNAAPNATGTVTGTSEDSG